MSMGRALSVAKCTACALKRVDESATGRQVLVHGGMTFVDRVLLLIVLAIRWDAPACNGLLVIYY